MEYDRGGRQKEEYTAEEVISVPCLLCGRYRCKEIYKERKALTIVRCLDCGLVYVNPRLKNPEQVYWGEADKYYEEVKLIFSGKAKHHRDPNYSADIRLMHKYKSTGNFLDIGTNMGMFLRNAKGLGWNLYGVEPSPSLSEMARKYFGLNVKTAFLEEANFERNFFDVVVMIDVFEHITQPDKMLSEIYGILKEDGILFIKVPNGLFNLFKFRMAKLLGKLKDYDIFDSYEHVVHYTQRTITAMLKKNSFRPIKFSIGKPIQIPIWHHYVGYYYHYPSPWHFDPVRQSARSLFYYLSIIEQKLRGNRIGWLAPNIIVIAKKIPTVSSPRES